MMAAFKAPDRFGSIARFIAHPPAFLLLEKTPKIASYCRIIVRNQDTDQCFLPKYHLMARKLMPPKGQSQYNGTPMPLQCTF